MQKNLRFARPACVVVVYVSALVVGCLPMRVDVSALPTEKDFPDVDAVVLNDETILRFERSGGAVVAVETSRSKVRVFGEGERRRLGTYAIYDRDFTTIDDLHATAILPDGWTRRYDRDDAADVLAFGGFVLYSDNRALVLQDDALPLGTTMEAERITRSKNPEFWAYIHCFDDTVPVKASTFEVHVPAGMEIDYAIMRDRTPIDLRTDDTTTPDGTRVVRLTLKNIPPLDDEPTSPGYVFAARCMHVRLRSYDGQNGSKVGYDDNRALSRWKHALVRPPLVVDSTIESIANEVLLEVSDADARTRAAHLYAWARDEVKYCAIEVGIGGWQPHASTETAKYRYGDCKDKANVLRALLKTQGITSDMVSIFSHDGYPKKQILPVLGGYFNHAILAVHLEDEIVLVDPTHPTAPFGDLPFNDEGADYLRSTPEGAQLAVSPFSTADENVEELTFSGTIDENGTFTGELRFRASGEVATAYRARFLYEPETAWNKALGQLLSIDAERLSEVRVQNARPPPLPIDLTGEARVVVPRVLQGELGTRLTGIARFVGLPIPDLGDRKRTQPILLGHRKKQIVTIDARLPRALVIEQVPEDAEERGSAISVFYSSKGTETYGELARLLLTRTLRIDEPFITSGALGDLRASRRRAAQLSGENVVLAWRGVP